MKANIQNNYFNLTKINEKIKNNLNIQTNELKKLLKILKINENKKNKLILIILNLKI